MWSHLLLIFKIDSVLLQWCFSNCEFREGKVRQYSVFKTCLNVSKSSMQHFLKPSSIWVLSHVRSCLWRLLIVVYDLSTPRYSASGCLWNCQRPTELNSSFKCVYRKPVIPENTYPGLCKILEDSVLLMTQDLKVLKTIEDSGSLGT